MDRLTYALLGALFGAAIGLAGWLLFGLGLSKQWAGPGIDPNLSHWVQIGSAVFAAIGFFIKDKAGDIVGEVIAGLFNYEAGNSGGAHWASWPAVVVIVLVAGGTWYLLSQL